MRFKKFSLMLLACAMIMSSFGMYAGAVETDKNSGAVIVPYASGQFSMKIPGNTLATADESFPLEEGESITISAFYSPASASVDFGVIAPDGLFYSVNVTNGSVDQIIEVVERGYYTLAIRNNSSKTVSVSGYVNY